MHGCLLSLHDFKIPPFLCDIDLIVVPLIDQCVSLTRLLDLFVSALMPLAGMPYRTGLQHVPIVTTMSDVPDESRRRFQENLRSFEDVKSEAE